MQEYEFKIFHKLGKHHHEAEFLAHSSEGEQEKSFRDEPVDAEFFQVECLHEKDPEWMEIRTFLLSGLVPQGLNTSERKASIQKTLKLCAHECYTASNLESTRKRC